MSDMRSERSEAIQYRYRFADLIFDVAAMTLKRAGEQVDVERTPLHLLRVLVENVDEVLTKDELLEAVWPGVITVENVLPNAIAKLRKALGEDAAQRIVTHPRIGYRFLGPIERQAVGRKLHSAYEFQQGQAVPQRSNWLLASQLSSQSDREVWMAQHAKTGEQRIFKFASSGEALSSLKREVTLFRLAKESLTDPLPIAEIIDWNFETEPFFIECEVAGEDFQKWARNNNRLSELTFVERIALSGNVVSAVARIHELGILHGDLKPSNIVISPAPGNDEDKHQIKLIDLGSSRLTDRKALDQANLTMMGLTVDIQENPEHGTPVYMAPERMRGQPSSTLGDIYSLGIIVYQIMAGDIDKPLASGWESDIEHPLLREFIAAAVRGDAELRLRSAGQLADQLTHFWKHEREWQDQLELETLSQEADAKLRRIRAQRPWIVSTACALIVALVGSTSFAWSANQANEKLRVSSQRVEASNRFLTEILVSGDPRTQGGSPEQTVADALSRASDIMPEIYADDSETQIYLLQTLGRVESGLGRFSESASAYQKALTLSESLYPPSSPQVQTARFDLADALVRNSEFDAAADVLKRAEEASGGEFEGVVRFRHAHSKGRLALLELQIEDARYWFETALEVLDEENAENLTMRSVIMRNLAQVYSRTEQHDLGISLLEPLLEPPYADGVLEEWELASAKSLLGATYMYNRQDELAEKTILEAVSELEAIFGPDGSQTLKAMNDLGVLYGDLARWTEAAEIFTRLRESVCASHGEQHMQCLAYLANEGITLVEAEKYAEAARAIRAARDGFAASVGEDYAGVHLLDYHLSVICLETGCVDEAGVILGGVRRDLLEIASPATRWDLLLPAAVLRQRILAGKHTPDDVDALQAIVDELIAIQSDPKLVARTSQQL
ncbi:tetratricopeptide repeat protein [Henriciella sp. AS95]|uniref:tetratricopeptide repeat protein n=1 Tax=Henriciella sp. AS95 TaxID=3135782 RepID=UPI0031722FC4